MTTGLAPASSFDIKFQVMYCNSVGMAARASSEGQSKFRLSQCQQRQQGQWDYESSGRWTRVQTNEPSVAVLVACWTRHSVIPEAGLLALRGKPDGPASQLAESSRNVRRII